MKNKEIIERLFIFGNGFDLSCGLKSSYSDFFEDIFILNPTTYGEDSKNNFWLRLFKELSTYSDSPLNNWTDIETQILLQLKNIEFLFDSFLILNLGNLEDGSSLKSKIANEIDRPTTKMKSILNVDSVLITYQLLKKEYNSFEIKQINEIQQRLKEDLIQLEEYFQVYLTKHLSSKLEVNVPIHDIATRLFDYRYRTSSLIDHLTRQYSGYNSIDYYLSFNYTSPYKNKLIRNIHGTLEKGNIIFGIDYDKAKNNFNKPPIEFTKSYRILENKAISTVNISNDLDYICFYGHGLGEADYSYFQSIFDSVDLYHGKTKLVFYWTQFGNSNQYSIQVERVTNLIEKYGQTFTNKDHGRNLFTKLLLENRIIFNYVNLNEVWKEYCFK